MEAAPVVEVALAVPPTSAPPAPPAPQQAVGVVVSAPVGASEAPAAAAAAPQGDVSGVLQRLYEQQQIFVYHAQQAQQAHLGCAQLLQRSGAAAGGPEATQLQVQAEQLRQLRAQMLSLHRTGGGAASAGPAPSVAGMPLPTPSVEVPPLGVAVVGEKRSSEAATGAAALAEAEHPAKRPRQPEEPAEVIGLGVLDGPTPTALPVCREDITGLGLPLPAPSTDGLLAAPPKIQPLPAEILKLDPTAQSFAPREKPDRTGGVAGGVSPAGSGRIPSQWIKRPWTAEQDEALRQAVAKHGAKNWSGVAEMCEPQACARSCRPALP